MEEVVTKAIVQHDEGIQQAQIIGIFIINSKHEMLLYKKTPPLDQATSWQPPYFVHHDSTKLPSDIAQLYVKKLGIECNLHEAFGPTKHCDHIIIALTKEQAPQHHFAAETYKWMSITSVLHAIQEHPNQYGSWFKTALEGIQLYIKSMNNSKHCEHAPIQQEI